MPAFCRYPLAPARLLSHFQGPWPEPAQGDREQLWNLFLSSRIGETPRRWLGIPHSPNRQPWQLLLRAMLNMRQPHRRYLMSTFAAALAARLRERLARVERRDWTLSARLVPALLVSRVVTSGSASQVGPEPLPATLGRGAMDEPHGLSNLWLLFGARKMRRPRCLFDSALGELTSSTLACEQTGSHEGLPRSHSHRIGR